MEFSCSKFNDNCPGNNSLNFGISKASKFASRVNEFKSAVLKENNKVLNMCLFV